MRILLLLSFLFSKACFATQIHPGLPEHIDPDNKYVFYSYGLIVEGNNPTPKHPRWGVYDFPMVKKKLSSPDYQLIAYHRAKGTQPKLFAKQLADDVLQLIDNGVDPKNIALIGFSRGGAITLRVSSLLARDDLTYIILAGCGDYLEKDRKLSLYGKVYSIIETSDQLVGSCQAIIDRSEHVQSFLELSISTGKEHGAFYTPLAEWVGPVKKWLADNY